MEFRSISMGATVPSSDKQQSVQVKKMPLSDLPNGTRNVITNPQETSRLPQEKGAFSDFLKISSLKRHSCDYASDPHHRSTCNNDTNGHLVYARRKLEGTGKISACGDVDMTTSQKRKFSDSERDGLSHQPDQVQETLISSSAAFSPLATASVAISSCGTLFPILRMPTSGFLSMEPSVISSGSPVQVISPSSNRVHWKERFLRLQMFLNSCDQSSQEEYVQMLRSLSAINRSKHAVELEKRAIHLLLEEGKELHRMKLLNVLGKVSPSHV